MSIIMSFHKKKSCQQIAFQNRAILHIFMFFPSFNSFISYKLMYMQLMQSKSLCEFIWLQYFIKIRDEVPVSHETDFCFHYCNSICNCQSWLTFQNMSFLLTEPIASNHNIFTKFLVIENPISLSWELYIFIWKIKIIE